jgi:hypothetical protein
VSWESWAFSCCEGACCLRAGAVPQLLICLDCGFSPFNAPVPELRALREEIATSTGMDEEVAKRRAIVRSNPNLGARELCELFDHRHAPVPRRWKDAGIEWWTKAYQSRFRGRVQNLISRDRTG